MSTGSKPIVLILGAGINGCSVARELVLNGVGAWVVDKFDIASGATSKSSRLIHGGLRYLEYRDIHLVRESLAERTTLLKVAPHLVEPLRLYIPVSQKSGGLLQSAARFTGVTRSKLLNQLAGIFLRPTVRGLWTVDFGLWMYDFFSSDPATPRHTVHDVTQSDVPHVDPNRYRWLCGYSDAQMRFPERYCVALLRDTQQVARETNVDFRLFTYATAERANGSLQIVMSTGEVVRCETPLVVNATGAWGDLTLKGLHVPSHRLFGGTKGSHFITHQPALKQALGRAGVYAEAADGRLIFVLPFGDAVLVGTTDERFEEPPDRAVASDEELSYLVSTVNQLFPDVRLSRADVTLTYSGVRPLPYVEAGAAGSISRDHSVEVSSWDGIPVLTLVGGKLTTSRAFGELVANEVLHRLSKTRSVWTTKRPVPGRQAIPGDDARQAKFYEELAAECRLDVSQLRAMWTLCGSGVRDFLEWREREATLAGDQRIRSSVFPRSFVRWIIEQEWAARIEDLVERRLMLIYEPGLSRQTMEDLADVLVEAGKLNSGERDAAIATAVRRCRELYGRSLGD